VGHRRRGRYGSAPSADDRTLDRSRGALDPRAWRERSGCSKCSTDWPRVAPDLSPQFLETACSSHGRGWFRTSDLSRVKLDRGVRPVTRTASRSHRKRAQSTISVRLRIPALSAGGGIVVQREFNGELVVTPGTGRGRPTGPIADDRHGAARPCWWSRRSGVRVPSAHLTKGFKATPSRPLSALRGDTVDDPRILVVQDGGQMIQEDHRHAGVAAKLATGPRTTTTSSTTGPSPTKATPSTRTQLRSHVRPLRRRQRRPLPDTPPATRASSAGFATATS
jgi:hypothetical protein